MVNLNLKNNAPGNTTTALPTSHKKSPLAVKRAALRDVHNGKKRTAPFIDGRLMEAIKVFGTKVVTCELPGIPPRTKSSWRNATNELPADAGISLDLELGKRRNQDTAGENADCLSQKAYFQKQPNLLEQQTKKLDHETSCLPAFAPVSAASPIASPGKSEQQRMEWLFRLQNLLKQCEESDQRNYIQMLHRLSPLELSRHAIELEKRSMQLSIEEAREIQRMKNLEILGASSNDRLSGFEKIQSKKN